MLSPACLSFKNCNKAVWLEGGNKRQKIPTCGERKGDVGPCLSLCSFLCFAEWRAGDPSGGKDSSTRCSEVELEQDGQCWFCSSHGLNSTRPVVTHTWKPAKVEDEFKASPVTKKDPDSKRKKKGKKSKLTTQTPSLTLK